MRSKSQTHLYTLVFIAMMTALVFVTNYLKINIPTPTGQTRLKIANAVCLLGGMMFGGLYGGIAAGVGSMLYDLLNGYASSALYSLFAFFVMGFLCGFISHRNKKIGLSTKQNIIGATVGAVSYFIIYAIKKIYFTGMLVMGFSLEAALAASSVSLITSAINAVFAVLVSVLIARPIIGALRKASLLQKIEA